MVHCILLKSLFPCQCGNCFFMVSEIPEFDYLLQAPSILPLLLYSLGKKTCPTLKLHILEALPKIATHKVGKALLLPPHVMLVKNMPRCFCDMSLVVRKPVFGGSDQVRHNPGCTATEAGCPVLLFFLFFPSFLFLYFEQISYIFLFFEKS